MGNTWSRVLLGIAVVGCLLGLGALEVLSQRVRVDTATTTAVPSEGVRPEPSGDALALHHDDLLGLGADPALTTEVSDEAMGVTAGRRAADLAARNPGDVIRIEPSSGQIQRIVVLRPAWWKVTSPEQ